MDAGGAGEGSLEILVQHQPSGNNVPTRVEMVGGARFLVTFLPPLPGIHTCNVTFNDEPVPGELTQLLDNQPTNIHENKFPIRCRPADCAWAPA